jgi:hypothetical protein
MVATPARIGFVTQEFRSALPTPDSAVKTKYGELARDSADVDGGIIETFFDDPADALTMATERLNLLKADRRRFKQDARGIQAFTGSLALTQTTPAATVIDDERAANHAAAIVEVAVDLTGEKTTFITWG